MNKLKHLLLAFCTVATLAGPAVAETDSEGDDDETSQVQPRKITFNDRALSQPELQLVEAIERAVNYRLPDGAYWYDRTSGAAGVWGGPIAVILPAGMPLGGKLPANASGGGKGRTTGVFVNGRELHPTDVAAFQWLFDSPVPRGSFTIDYTGRITNERGAFVASIGDAIARKKRAAGGNRAHVGNGLNGNSWVNGGCVSVRLSSGTTYSSGGCG
jgi:hypothetical protein